MTDVLLSATTIATDSEIWAPGYIHVVGSRIASCGRGGPPARIGSTRLHIDGAIVPGFVDMHSHGAAGVSFADAAHASIASATDWHAYHGTTSLIASLATASLPELGRQMAALADYVADGAILGIHLEGPWLSAAQRGAHAEALLRVPVDDDVEQLLASTDILRMVTLAPELPGGMRAIRAITDAGPVAAIGHTACDAATARQAFDNGATVATHLFNGMAPFHHRAPGPASQALLDERVTLELILDGEHLASETVDLIIRAADRRIAAVSDSISATGCPDGAHVLAGSRVEVKGGVARTADSGSLAGSTQTLDSAFAVLVSEHGRSLPEAVAATSTTAARALNLGGIGEIAPGASADLVVLEELRVIGVMKRGAWVRSPI